MSWVTDAFGSWYLTIYPHRDAAEAERLVRALSAVVPVEGGRILDVGCGPGRHLVSFHGARARPVGLDLSPELLNEAVRVRVEAGGDWPLVRGDMLRLPFRNACLDGVTSLFTSFGYFEEAGDGRALREAARVLRPGGFHVLDFLNRRRVLEHPNPQTERLAGRWRIQEVRTIEAGRRVVKRVTVHPAAGGPPAADYEERVTLYEPEELRGMLRESGLAPFRVWGEYDGSPFDDARSSRCVVLSRRVEG